ncbi:MAG: hypothetical protein ACLSAF_11790 [Intestinimonas sp.]
MRLPCGGAAGRDGRPGAEPGRRGESRYYVSDSVEDFSRLASIFLRQDVAAEVTQVDIWRY